MINDIKQDAQARMAKSIDALRQTLTSIRTGRASPALLDRVTVNAYGNPSTPLNQVASGSNADAPETTRRTPARVSSSSSKPIHAPMTGGATGRWRESWGADRSSYR